MLRWTVFVCVCEVPCRRARWLCQVQMTKIKCYDITTPHQAAVAVCVCVCDRVLVDQSEGRGDSGTSSTCFFKCLTVAEGRFNPWLHIDTYIQTRAHT